MKRNEMIVASGNCEKHTLEDFPRKIVSLARALFDQRLSSSSLKSVFRQPGTLEIFVVKFSCRERRLGGRIDDLALSSFVWSKITTIWISFEGTIVNEKYSWYHSDRGRMEGVSEKKRACGASEEFSRRSLERGQWYHAKLVSPPILMSSLFPSTTWTWEGSTNIKTCQSNSFLIPKYPFPFPSQINGVDVTNATHEEAVNAFKNAGDKLDITVRRLLNHKGSGMFSNGFVSIGVQTDAIEPSEMRMPITCCHCRSNRSSQEFSSQGAINTIHQKEDSGVDETGEHQSDVDGCEGNELGSKSEDFTGYTSDNTLNRLLLNTSLAALGKRTSRILPADAGQAPYEPEDSAELQSLSNGYYSGNVSQGSLEYVKQGTGEHCKEEERLEPSQSLPPDDLECYSPVNETDQLYFDSELEYEYEVCGEGGGGGRLDWSEYDSWQARVCMRVSSTLMSWSNENKSCMRVDKREFAWEFHQLSCPGQTRTTVAWELTSESLHESFINKCLVESFKSEYPRGDIQLPLKVKTTPLIHFSLRWEFLNLRMTSSRVHGHVDHLYLNMTLSWAQTITHVWNRNVMCNFSNTRQSRK